MKLVCLQTLGIYYCYFIILVTYLIVAMFHCRVIPEPALELMDKMLALDPTKRISAEESLKHPFLDINPDDISPPE